MEPSHGQSGESGLLPALTLTIADDDDDLTALSFRRLCVL
jgi:hypothetical protein